MDKEQDTKANLEAKIAQASRLSAAITDQRTAESLEAFVADLQNRLRDLGE